MVQRPSYLGEYAFNWETFDVVCSGKSSLDATNYLTDFYDKGQVTNFLYGYGFDITDPVESAELFGIFQEALVFIKRYFLIEGNPDGLDLKVPNYLYSITNVSDLFLQTHRRFLSPCGQSFLPSFRSVPEPPHDSSR